MRKLVVVALALAAACRRPEPPLVPEVVVVSRLSLPADPGDGVWRDAPVHVAALLPQDMVEPRLLQPSTSTVRVQGVTDGRHVAFRLAWDDATGDDVALPARFSDACAVQFPRQVSADVPAPQMGEAGRGVEITLWRASWQATVDGRGDTIKDLYPNAAVDHYPFEAAALEKDPAAQAETAKRYAPARALGNAMAGPRSKPVEDLVAEGPGTLSPGPPLDSAGRGARTKTGWVVVVARRLPAGLAPGTRTQVALAVWEGSREEAGSRKMRTGWIPLAIEAAR